MDTSTLPLDRADDIALRQLVADLQHYQDDVDAFMARHTSDASIVNIAGRRVAGADEIRSAMQAALASPLAQVMTTLDVDDIRLVDANVAIVACIKHVHDEREGAEPGALPRRGRLTYVVVRGADGWQVTSAQTTPIVAA
jgi:uncharacterized protein (TIGR02246 family)